MCGVNMNINYIMHVLDAQYMWWITFAIKIMA